MAARPTSTDRRRRRPPSERISTLRRLLAVWLIGLAGLAIVSLQTSVPVESLMLDASVVGGGHWYSGLVTSLTVLGWALAVVSLGLASFTCRVAGRSAASRTMGSMAVIIAVLLFDDLLQLHSAVVPRLLGGPKWTLILLEGAAVILWFVRWNGEVVRTRWELLVAAGIGFAISLAVDGFPLTDGRSSLLVEDGAKVLAVLALATWAVSSAADLIRSMASGTEDLGRSSPVSFDRRERHGGHRDVVV